MMFWDAQAALDVNERTSRSEYTNRSEWELNFGLPSDYKSFHYKQS